MLDGNLKAQLKGYLQRISQPVEILACADDGEKSRNSDWNRRRLRRAANSV